MSVGGVKLYEGNHVRQQMLKENHKDQAATYWPFVTFLSDKL